MYKLMNTIICVALVCCSALAQTKTGKREVSFAKEKFETTLNAAYEKKDANAVGEQLASIYNEGGVSREMAVRQIQELFQKTDLKVHYRVVGFHQFPGTKIGYAQVVTEISVGGKNAAVRTLQTAGYLSMINEGGSWRAFASQPAGGCPKVQNFAEEVETGNWSGWGSQLNPAGFASGGLSEGALPQFSNVFNAPRIGAMPPAHSFADSPNLPKFNKEEWEERYRHAWNTKNVAEILGFYGSIYNEFGLNKAAVRSALTKTLEDYAKIDIKYRVLGFTYLPGTKLASLKAVMDLRGVRKGASEPTPILQVMGYASLIAEGKQWKVYATQLFTTPAIEKASFESLQEKEWPPHLDLTVKR
jgi:hypothetical protein